MPHSVEKTIEIKVKISHFMTDSKSSTDPHSPPQATRDPSRFQAIAVMVYRF